MRSRLSCGVAVVALAGWFAVGTSGQVVLDGTTGPVRDLTGPTYNILETDGTLSGANLFHSFSEFNLLSSGDVAEFSGSSPGIANVLARVTGSDQSVINGTLRCTIANANLFFINPNGVVFNQSAQVDVSGAFVVTTADVIKLADGGRFDVAHPANDLLTMDAPSAFGFSGPMPAVITVNAATLAVPTGKVLSFIGGQLQAPQGQINGLSVASAGEVPVTLDVSGVAQLGDITISDGALLDVSASTGGRVMLRGDDVVVDDSSIFAHTLGAGLGGTVDIEATLLEVVNGGVITSDKLSTGNGGLVQIVAEEVIVDGFASGIGARSLPGSGGGTGGTLDITTGTLSLLRGGQLSATTDSSANAGEITVTADDIEIRGEGQVTGILADATTIASGNAGEVTVTAATLHLQNAGRITAASGGTGNGGQIQVTATESLTIDGDDGILFTGIGAPSLNPDSPTRTGTLMIDAGRLWILDGGQILASAFGLTEGGSIEIDAADVLIDREDALHATGLDARAFGSGTGGNIDINARTVTLRNGSDITAAAQADGGNILLKATKLVYLLDSALSAASATGNGGNINIDPPFVVLNDSTITANAPAGQGGDILVVAAGFLADDSVVTATGLEDGTVEIQSPDTDLTGSLLVLDESVLGADAQLPERCAVRLPGAGSTFVASGRGGLPVSPTGLLASFAPDAPAP